MQRKLFYIRVIISVLFLFNISLLFVEAADQEDSPVLAVARFNGWNHISPDRSESVATFRQELISATANESIARKNASLVVMKVDDNIMTVDGVKAQIDNRNPEIVPFTLNDSVYAPLSIIAKQFGVTPTYENNIYTIETDNQAAIINLFTNKAYIDGKLVSVNGFYHKGYFYLPIDLIAQILNKTVQYEENSVVIGDKELIQSIQRYKEGVRIPVLMYHHFDPNYQDGTTVNPAVFEQQMLLLKNEGYTTITTQDLIAISKGEKVMPEKPIIITMDDAYESNYQYVYPVLKKLNMKATIFVITSYIEHPEVDNIPIPKMTWAMMKEMSDSGLVAFQSHTNNLHYLAGGYGAINTPIKVNGQLETQEQFEERIYHDLALSKQILEDQLGKEVTSFAYPKGLYSATSEAVLKRAGFELTLTTDKGLYNTKANSLYLMKRVNVHGKASAQSILATVNKVKAM